MARAIALAAPTHPHPNPRVGAVVLDGGGNILGEGAHSGPGHPHAEVVALAHCDDARGSTLVVTLEPCDHTGRTPPCTEAIIAAGVARVVVGAIDPDPKVAGRGVERLRRAGIEVTTGILAEEVEEMDPGYFHHRRHGRALTVVKTAATLDGQAAPRDGRSRWLTGEAARADVHRLRAGVDAVMIGANTLRVDDPRLDVRLPGYEGPQPRPVVVKGERALPPGSRLWEREALVVATEPVAGQETLVVSPDETGRPALRPALVALAEAGILTVMVEGGPALIASLWREGVADRGVTYLAARAAGGMGLPMIGGRWERLADARPVRITDVRLVGEDVRIDWTAV